jgi:hypothetical protein
VKRIASQFVMPGLVPGIHVFETQQPAKTWMAGTSPAMTALFGEVNPTCGDKPGHDRVIWS